MILASAPDWNIIVPAFFTMLTVIVTTWLQNRRNDRKAVEAKGEREHIASVLAEKTDAVATTLAAKVEAVAQPQNEQLDAIHKTVNGQSEAMRAELTRSEAENVRLRAENAQLRAAVP